MVSVSIWDYNTSGQNMQIQTWKDKLKGDDDDDNDGDENNLNNNHIYLNHETLLIAQISLKEGAYNA